MRAELWHQTGSELPSFPRKPPGYKPSTQPKNEQILHENTKPSRGQRRHTGFSNEIAFSSISLLNLATESNSRTRKPCSLLRSCRHVKVGSFSCSPDGRSSGEHTVPRGLCHPHRFCTDDREIFLEGCQISGLTPLPPSSCCCHSWKGSPSSPPLLPKDPGASLGEVQAASPRCARRVHGGAGTILQVSLGGKCSQGRGTRPTGQEETLVRVPPSWQTGQRASGTRGWAGEECQECRHC